MRIAVFIKSTTFHKNFGGLETQNKVLCEGLAKRGHDVMVFSPAFDLKIAPIEEKGVKYIFLDCVYRMLPFSFSKPHWLTKSYSEFKKVHLQKPFDLILSQSSAGRGIIKHKSVLGIKAISISHGSVVSEFKTNLLNTSSLGDCLGLIKNLAYVLVNYFSVQRDFILHSNKVIAVSGAVKKSLMNETFVPEECVDVIHNGIDPAGFPMEGRDVEVVAGKVRVIYIGRVIKSKGLFVLIGALENMKHLNFEVIIVGDGEDLERLRKYVDKKSLNKFVKFEGKIPHVKVKEKLLESDIFVLPSLRVEGFPMTLVEAMFAGLPTVASNIGGIPEAIDNGQNGFLVLPGNKEELKEKLSDLILDFKKRQYFGKNARLKAEKEFSIDTMLDKYEKVFEEIAK